MNVTHTVVLVLIDGDHRVQQVGFRIQIGNKELNCDVGIFRPDRADAFGPVGRAAVGQVIACNGGYHHMPQSHQTDAFGEFGGF